jgi:hypothetical protein
MPEPTSRTPTTLLVVILLAVLVEPFLLAMIFAGGEEPAAARQDPRLAGAIEDLVAALKERRADTRLAPAPAEGGAAPAPDAVLERIAKALERRGSGMSEPQILPEGAAPAGREFGYESIREVLDDDLTVEEAVDAVVRQEMERASLRKPVDNTRFLYQSMETVLSSFGRPSTVSVYNGWVRWYFQGKEQNRRFYVDIMNGRVVRFGF